MAESKSKMNYRRKREGRTNYKKRLVMLSSRIPRLVVRFSNKMVIAQLTEYSDKGDKVLLTVTSSMLRKYGWNYSLSNMPSAYLTGLLIGHKSKSKKIKNAIFDIGFKTSVKGGKLYSVLKGAVDANLSVPCDESVFPKMERITGQHIKKFATQNQSDNNQFSNHKKNNVDLQKIEQVFNDIKNKIMSE